jgi:phage-related protein
MNEELKIIITAMTAKAVKGIQDIKKELGGVTGSAKGASKGMGAAMKGVVGAAAVAVKAIGTIGTALVLLGRRTLDYQKAQAKLNTAFQAVGSTAQQAAESYKGLYRFLGDEDTSVEAAGHLAKLTTNQQELAEWTKICQGVYATFGDSLKIEALTEAANETARVGKVTGAFADALNWAGVSEDEFNAKLAQTTSYEEREALLRETLNGLYGDAAKIYEENNKALLEHNESQARLNSSMGAAGAAVTPLLTALNNLSAALFDALKPALDVIIPAVASFVNWITQSIQAVMGLFGIVTGGSSAVNTFAQMGSSLGSASNGADKLTGNLGEVEKAAEKVKRATMGFDELNIVSSGSSSSSSGSGASGGSTAPGYMAPTVDASKFTVEVEHTENQASGLAATMKRVAEDLKEVFAPTITAWTTGFETIKESWGRAKEDFIEGGQSIGNAFSTLGSYVVGTFVPDLVNSFSTNLAPMFTDIFGFALEEAGKNFKFLAGIIEDATSTIIIPALELIGGVFEDVFEIWGDAWDKNGQPILEEMGKALGHLRTTFTNIYEQFIKPIVDKVITTLETAWNNTLKPVYEKVVAAFMEIGRCLLQLYNEFIAPIIDWIVAYILPIVKGFVDRLIEWGGKILEDIGTVIGGIITFFEGVIQFITGVFTGDWDKAWEGIKNIFSGIWDVICGVVSAAWDTITAIFDWEKTKEFFIGVWEAIKAAWDGVVAWFESLFTDGWDSAVEAFSGAGEWFAGIWEDIKNAFSEVGTWFSENFSAAWEDIKLAWNAVGQWFEDLWEDIKEVFAPVDAWFKEKFEAAWTAIEEAWDGVAQWFSDIWTSIENTFSAVGDWFTKIFTDAWTGIENAWSSTTQFFSDIWADIETTFEGVGQWFEDKFSEAWTSVEEAWSGCKTFFEEKWTEIQEAFADVKEVLKKKFEDAYKAVTDAWSGTKTFFKQKWEGIQQAFGDVKGWFKTKFNEAWSGVQLVWKDPKTFFSNKWKDIKGAFGNISKWFEDEFSGAWEKVKNVFSDGGETFEGIKDGILNGLKTVINGLIDGINWVIAQPFNGINNALSKVRDVKIAGWYPFEDLSLINVPQIPYLAKGGIVDQATLAMIGERGREAVVPLENNTEWMDKLVEKLAAKTQAPSKIVLMLDGKELGWANINSINNITRQTGSLQLQLA